MAHHYFCSQDIAISSEDVDFHIKISPLLGVNSLNLSMDLHYYLLCWSLFWPQIAGKAAATSLFVTSAVNVSWHAAVVSCATADPPVPACILKVLKSSLREQTSEKN